MYPEVHLARLGRPLFAVLAGAVLLTGMACGSGDAANDPGVGIATTVRDRTPGANEPTATPQVSQADVLRGFIFPIVGGCLPQGSQLMPNAPREYRGGTHEGVDFYNVDNCTPIDASTPVVAVKAGRIIRVDTSYRDPTPEEMADYLSKPNDPSALDKLRGRQVWIDHGAGVITRYCHLSGVAGITVGAEVDAGDLVGYVGNSGTPESLQNPGAEMHLHFEVRVGDGYLGKGQTTSEVRALYQALFR
jgi:murein DD-endopeptidase MepM/ murein hydrolase activator NlpD